VEFQFPKNNFLQVVQKRKITFLCLILLIFQYIKIYEEIWKILLFIFEFGNEISIRDHKKNIGFPWSCYSNFKNIL
jgi:hypothetical protein